jgi:M6 family metalloprotease-like protein
LDGELVPTSFVVGKYDPALEGLSPNLNLSPEEIYEIRQRFLKQTEDEIGGMSLHNAPTTGAINNLVVFIRFSNENASVFTKSTSEYNSMLNSSTSGANSLYNYYREVSYNQLSVNSSLFPTPGTTIISYQDSQPRGYYQPYNASTNPIGYTGGDDGTMRREREHTLLRNAINYINGLGQFPSAANIDRDNDGYVDSVTFVVSGSPNGWSSLLWPHMWALYTYDVRIQGKQIWEYALQLESMIHAGVLAHEMFHVLGAPDLYRYYNYDEPVGPWDLMAVNSDISPHMGCYMKYKYGGWINSIPQIGSGTYTLNSLTSSTNNCYKIASPNSSTEFFIVEYRNKASSVFENSAPDSGLLVYRINTEVSWGNADGPPDEVYIFRPGGTPSADGNIYQANFSQSVGRTRINDTTDPYSFLSNGSLGGLNLCDVGMSGATIDFHLGDCEPDIYESDNTSGQAQWIYSETPQIHNIRPASDVDWVKFTLTTASAVLLETTGTTSSNTEMNFYDSSLTVLEYNDDGGKDYYSKIDRVCNVDALPSGTYYVKINALGNNTQIPSYTLSFKSSPCPAASIDVGVAGNWQGSYLLASGQEQRLNFNISGGPLVVQSLSGMDVVSAIRLQSYVNNTLYSFVETMGVPEGLLSYKYYFPTYNNTWAPLNSQVRFSNLSATSTRIRVTIAGKNVWEQDVPGLEERRLYFNESGGPVVIESLDTTKKIVAAIRLQSYPNGILYSFSETMGIPAEYVSHKYYFPTYNNTWVPLNSQIRFGNLESTSTRIRVTIGGEKVWEEDVPGLEERRLYFDKSGGPVVIESLDPNKKIVAAIRLQSYVNNTLYSFLETMGVPEGLLSHKYYFPTYNNTWAPLNSQVRFGNLSSTTTRIRVTIGGDNVWEQDVPGLEERRLYFNVSGGPVIIESLDTNKKIVAAIRLQSYPNNILYSFSETMGIPAAFLSGTYYFPTYNNTWTPLNSQLRFGVP